VLHSIFSQLSLFLEARNDLSAAVLAKAESQKPKRSRYQFPSPNDGSILLTTLNRKNPIENREPLPKESLRSFINYKRNHE